MGEVLVAYAPGDADVGARVAKALTAAGHTVDSAGPPSLKSEKSRFDTAETVVLVWSRHAAAEAALRREAAVAAAAGRLVIAQVDAVRPPPSLRTRRRFAVTRTDPIHGPRALARALDTSPPRSKPMTPALDQQPPSTWKGTLLLFVLLAALAYGAATVAFGPAPVDAITALFRP